MSRGMVHTHTHSQYSKLDGYSSVRELLNKTVRDGGQALGITDHGHLAGLADFAKQAREFGVKALFGQEFYMAVGSRFEQNSIEVPRNGSIDPDTGTALDPKPKRNFHLTVFARNRQGWKNLIALSSDAYMNGWYYTQRSDEDIMAERSEGLIALSGCLGSQMNAYLMKGEFNEALKVAAKYRDMVGPENFFVELMDHGIEAQKLVLPSQLKIAKMLGVQTIVSQDAHYAEHECAGPGNAHDAFLCLSTQDKLSNPDRFRFTWDASLLAPEEMRAIHKEDWWQKGCDNTLLLAEMCDNGSDMIDLTPTLPEPPIPTEWSGREPEYLRHLVSERAPARWDMSDKVSARLEHELDIIISMGVERYFLIVNNIVEQARQEGIRVGPGRGSAAGCAVACALGITSTDPIRYDLLFDRFLNPDRVSMPDIDIDFEAQDRDRVVNILEETYGVENVARLGTNAMIGTRGSIRDAARVHGYPVKLGNDLAKKCPPLEFGKDVSFERIFGENGYEPHRSAQELRDAVISSEENKRTLTTARMLEGRLRGYGMAASGIIVSAEPLTEILPLRHDGEKACTQWEGKLVEALGFLKLDFLGINNLTLIEMVRESVRRRKEEAEAANNQKVLAGLEHAVRWDATGDLDVDWVVNEDFHPDLAGMWAMLGAGDSTGVFQLESNHMRNFLRAAPLRGVADIAALSALGRPGPMGEGLHLNYLDRVDDSAADLSWYEDWTNDPTEQAAIHEVLGDTRGCLVYQEQVMKMSRTMAGFTRGEPDSLRKACGKKIQAEMDVWKDRWVEGFVNNGFSETTAQKMWRSVSAFADYAFNKSHAISYSEISVMTAYLRWRFPADFTAAMLAFVSDNVDRMECYADAAHRNIRIVAPSIMQPSAKTMVSMEGDRVFLSLADVAEVGDSVVAAIVEEFKANGEFDGLADLVLRVPRLSITHVTNMIKAGALDCFGSRLGLLSASAAILESDSDFKKRLEENKQVGVGVKAKGGRSGFSVPIPNLEAPITDRQLWELETLRVVLTGSLIESYKNNLRETGKQKFAGQTIHKVETAHNRMQGDRIILAGVVGSADGSVAGKGRNAGKTYGKLEIWGENSQIEVFVSAKLVAKLAAQEDASANKDFVRSWLGRPVLVSGSITVDDYNKDDNDEETNPRNEMFAYDLVFPVTNQPDDGKVLYDPKLVLQDKEQYAKEWVENMTKPEAVDNENGFGVAKEGSLLQPEPVDNTKVAVGKLPESVDNTKVAVGKLPESVDKPAVSIRTPKMVEGWVDADSYEADGLSADMLADWSVLESWLTVTEEKKTELDPSEPIVDCPEPSSEDNRGSGADHKVVAEAIASFSGSRTESLVEETDSAVTVLPQPEPEPEPAATIAPQPDDQATEIVALPIGTPEHPTHMLVCYQHASHLLTSHTFNTPTPTPKVDGVLERTGIEISENCSYLRLENLPAGVVWHLIKFAVRDDPGFDQALTKVFTEQPDTTLVAMIGQPPDSIWMQQNGYTYVGSTWTKTSIL